METTLRLIGLTRKSKGEDEGTHQDQAERIRARLAHEKATLVNRPGDESDPFYEHKVSGGKDWKKRAFGRAIEAIRAGKADGIIVAYEDRVSREGLEAAVAIWKELGHLEAVFIACDGVDSRQEGAEFTFNLKAAVAAEQLRLYTVRSNGGRKRAVEMGVHAGVKPPPGYLFTDREDGDKNVSGNVKHGPLAPDPEKAHLIPQAFEARAARKPWSVILDILGMEAQGNAYQTLTNRVYLGEARSGEYVKIDAHPALVSEELFNRVQETFGKGSGSSRERQGKPKALLARVLHCGSCGRRMKYDRTIKSYRCAWHTCPRKAHIRSDKLEPTVLFEALLWHATLNPMYAEAHSEEEIAVRAQALGTAIAERDEIESAEAELSTIDYARAMTKAREAVTHAEAALRDAEASNGWLGMSTDAVQMRLFGSVSREETFLDSFSHLLDVNEARDFIQTMVRVTVKPCKKGTRPPVEDRIEVEQLTPIEATVKA